MPSATKSCSSTRRPTSPKSHKPNKTTPTMPISCEFWPASQRRRNTPPRTTQLHAATCVQSKWFGRLASPSGDRARTRAPGLCAQNTHSIRLVDDLAQAGENFGDRLGFGRLVDRDAGDDERKHQLPVALRREVAG